MEKSALNSSLYNNLSADHFIKTYLIFFEASSHKSNEMSYENNKENDIIQNIPWFEQPQSIPGNNSWDTRCNLLH